MNLLKNGPYIYAVGSVGRPDFTVHSARVPQGLENPAILFADDGSFKAASPLSREEMQQPLPQPVLKASGVARARNAAKSTIFAALLAQDFVKYINELPGFDPDRVVIGVCNCSSSAAISWQFETEGVTIGWEKTNTMLMPSSLPSAIGTQISAAVKTHAATISFLNDILGMCAAMEYTYTSFFHERSDFAFILGAEEFSMPHEKVMSHLKRSPGVMIDGAAGILLAREKLPGVEWRLALCSHTATSGEEPLPEAWQQAKCLRLSLEAEDAPFSTLLFPYALNSLFRSATGNRVVLIVEVGERSRFTLGFER